MKVFRQILIALSLCIACTFSACLSANAREIEEGTRILVWSTILNTNNKKNYVDAFITGLEDIYSEAYGNKVSVDTLYGTDRKELPDLSDYSLVYVIWPGEMATDKEINELDEFVNKGGRLVFIAEHNGFAYSENVILSNIAAKLGADFTILNGSYGGSNYKSIRNENSPIYSGTVEQNYVAPIAYEGEAEWVFKIEESGEEIVWCVDQKAGLGKITVISDIDFIYDWVEDPVNSHTEPTEFIKLVLEDSVENIEIVARGRIRPADVEDNEGNATIANDTLENILDFSDEEAEMLENGSDVLLYLNVKDISDTVSEDEKNLISSILKTRQIIGMYLDITLFKQINGGELIPVTTTLNKIKIDFEIPAELQKKNRVFYVVCLHDGKVTLTKATLKNNIASFEADKFSTYALVYEDKSNNPQTSDSMSTYYLIIALGFVALSTGLLLVKVKVRE